MKNLLLALTCLALSACSFVDEREDTARLAVMYATIKVIDEDADRADRVIEITREVKGYASGEASLTVEGLIAEVRDQIRWDRLDAADELLVQALLIELRDRLKERFDGDYIPQDLAITVDKVADWVISAAAMV